MGWGIATYIFGGIAIVGPLCIVAWYWKAAKKKFREFSAAAEGAGEGTTEAPPAPGDGA